MKMVGITFLVAFLQARGVLSTCLQRLLPPGHIQINIVAGPGVDQRGSLLDYGNNSFTVYDSCVSGFSPPPSAYVIILHEISDFEDAMTNVSCNHKRWWPSVWTVIVLRNLTLGKHEGELYARQIFQVLWTKAVYSGAVLIERTNIVYKADPFANGNRCGLEAVNVYSANCEYTPLQYRTTFPGCRIQVSARDSFPFSVMTPYGLRGSDVMLTKLIADKSNLKIDWAMRPTQYIGDYSVAHAYYQNISRNEIDLAIGGSVVSYTYFDNVTYAYSHVTQYLYFYVADGGELRGWMKLVAMFSSRIWLYILLTFIFTVITLSIFGSKKTSDYFLIVLGILVEETVSLPSGKLRIVMLWIVFPFYYISSMYTTILHSYTMSPPSTWRIETLEDLLEANYSVMLSDTNRFITQKVLSNKIRQVMKRSLPSPGLEEAARLLDVHRNFALAERDLEMTCVMGIRGYNFHHIDYKVSTIRNALVYPKGSKYGKRFHKIIMSAIESGLTVKWVKDMINLRKSAVGAQLTKRPISWHDLESAFTILIAGHAIATLVLFAEILISKLVKQNNVKYNLHSDVFY